jgi:uncharacterized Ntn-hydrolase superfamily protein
LLIALLVWMIPSRRTGNWYDDRLDASSAPIPELERTGKYRVTPLKMIETTPVSRMREPETQQRGSARS